MKKIFVTAIGGDIGYAIIKSLRRSHYNLYIIGCDIKQYNYSYDLVDEFFVSPAYKDENKWLEFVSEIIANSKSDFFWPVTEQEIKIVNSNRDVFCNSTIIMNSPEILKVALDKERTVDFLKMGGLLVPKTWKPMDYHEKLFPVIVKEKFGCGSHSVYIVNSENELNNIICYMEDPIIQEYIGDDSNEYTLTIFSDGEVVNYIAFRRTLGFGGMSRYVELVFDEKIEELAFTVADLFSLKGSINIQMRRANNNYYIFEINPRISSTMGFRLQLGFNDVEWWLNMLEGKSILQYSRPTQKAMSFR